ncbi:MAG: uroporphyrinogen-III synthase [Pseudomonadota bacterium]
MRLLLTRPAHQSKRSAKKLKALGHLAIVEPLLEREFLKCLRTENQLSAYGGALFTSANGVDAIVELGFDKRLSALPALTVGQATARSLRQAGWKRVTTVDGDSAAMVKELPTWLHAHGLEGQRLVYPCAETVSRDLSLNGAGIGAQIDSLPVYRMTEREEFSKDVQRALQHREIDGVLLYSARTAACFEKLTASLTQTRLGSLPRIFTVSPAVKDALSPRFQENAVAARAPNEEALFALLD